MTFAARVCIYLKALDCAFTYAILRLGGSEMNPSLRYLIDLFGPERVLVLNFLFTASLILLLSCFNLGRRFLPVVAELLFLVIFYQTGLIIWRTLL